MVLIDELKAIKAELGDDNSESGDGKGDDGTAKSDNTDDENKEDREKIRTKITMIKTKSWRHD